MMVAVMESAFDPVAVPSEADGVSVSDGVHPRHLVQAR